MPPRSRPKLRYVAANFRITGWLWWRKVALPAVLPFYVTGAITASGGSWNAAIVAELATWGDTQVQARGLGAYIAEATTAGDFHRIVLGIGTNVRALEWEMERDEPDIYGRRSDTAPPSNISDQAPKSRAELEAEAGMYLDLFAGGVKILLDLADRR